MQATPINPTPPVMSDSLPPKPVGNTPDFSSILKDATQTPSTYEWQENGVATLKSDVPFLPSLPPLFFNLPPHILATFHPGITECIHRLKQLTIRRGETTLVPLPDFNITIRVSKSNLTGELSVVLLVKPEEVALYKEGVQFVSGQTRGILFEVREGINS